MEPTPIAGNGGGLNDLDLPSCHLWKVVPKAYLLGSENEQKGNLSSLMRSDSNAE